MINAPAILAAGLSPAWQHTLVFDGLTRGAVNRALASAWCASGKVINVARALANVRATARVLCLVGGPTGQSIRDEFATEGIAARWIESCSPTRVCTTLVESAGGPTTELVENVGPATRGELDAFRAAYVEEAAGASYVVLSGSLPTGAPQRYFADLLASTPCPAVLDFRGDELLACLEYRPLLVKPNRQELAATLGRDLSDDFDLGGAVRELHDRGAQWVLVTDGPRPAFLAATGPRFCLKPPTIRTVNPIGSGDSLAAVLTWGLSRGMSMPDAVRLGMAAAIENALELLPARFDPQRLERRAAEIHVDASD